MESESQNPQVPFDDDVHSNVEYPTSDEELPSISFGSILESLNLRVFSLTINDILKYAVVSLSVVVALLYLFPSNLVIVLLLLVLIALLIIGVVLKRASLESKTTSPISSKPINKEKLNKLRAQFMKKK
ncbi:hypothetical protein [Tomelloso virus]|uniref:Uncharacterized protein n=1 Tax=Tomelloso virus TaxID=2053981 RepID=A0A2H4T2U8_9VIRU|nr:hypothetical protein [Tomelloso virus]ATY70255.1 hypothetical protein [Tomelloso virus]